MTVNVFSYPIHEVAWQHKSSRFAVQHLLFLLNWLGSRGKRLSRQSTWLRRKPWRLSCRLRFCLLFFAVASNKLENPTLSYPTNNKRHRQPPASRQPQKYIKHHSMLIFWWWMDGWMVGWHADAQRFCLCASKFGAQRSCFCLRYNKVLIEPLAYTNTYAHLKK